jgi:hypothetical protein
MTVHRIESLQRLAELLEPALVDSLNWSGISLPSLPVELHEDVRDVLANVDHFVADSDIRSRDTAYRSMQEEQMRQLIAALRLGASRDELLSFSFLGR